MYRSKCGSFIHHNLYPVDQSKLTKIRRRKNESLSRNSPQIHRSTHTYNNQNYETYSINYWNKRKKNYKIILNVLKVYKKKKYRWRIQIQRQKRSNGIKMQSISLNITVLESILEHFKTRLLHFWKRFLGNLLASYEYEVRLICWFKWRKKYEEKIIRNYSFWNGIYNIMYLMWFLFNVWYLSEHNTNTVHRPCILETIILSHQKCA